MYERIVVTHYSNIIMQERAACMLLTCRLGERVQTRVQIGTRRDPFHGTAKAEGEGC